MGHKRFGLEGAESLIPLVDEVLDQAAAAGIQEAVLGMAHRGRLNLLANIVGKPLRKIFREFEGNLDPETTQGSGDVKYHLGAAGKFVGRSGQPLPVTLASNPSHLEAVDPVVEGMVRAKQDLIDDPEAFAVLPLVIHGDAAFAGQGVVAETLNLSALRGYRVGGTIHLVVNNQLGFTTAPAEARSSVYATDVAKMVQAPIFHVNGDDPEACLRVARLAFGFRQRFHKDVVIDMVCYRRHGHNEGDDPSFTQPLMYKQIEGRRSVRKLYTETLVRRGDITADEAEKALDDFLARMQTAFEETRQSAPPGGRSRPAPTPVGHAPAGRHRRGPGRARPGGRRRCTPPPDGFTVHPKLAKVLEARHQPLRARARSTGRWPRPWPSGRCCWRAPTSAWPARTPAGARSPSATRCWSTTRPAPSASPWPAWRRPATQGKFWVYDSLLSEYAALGFEYGYSAVHTEALVAWEAQFGDFGNGAQIVIDQFIAAAESKWGQTLGPGPAPAPRLRGPGPGALVGPHRALPHPVRRRQPPGRQPHHRGPVLPRPAPPGAPGPAPAAGAAHAQVAAAGPQLPLAGRRAGQRPLPGGPRRPRRRPTRVDRAAVRRVVLASGKVALDAIAHRDQRGLPAAVVRVEQLYPWPGLLILDTVVPVPDGHRGGLAPGGAGEHGRRGTSCTAGCTGCCRDGLPLRHVSRPESASPASGSHTVHQHEQAELLERRSPACEAVDHRSAPCARMLD